MFLLFIIVMVSVGKVMLAKLFEGHFVLGLFVIMCLVHRPGIW